MVKIRNLPGYLRHIKWYVAKVGSIPLCADLESALPLPELSNVRVLWPNRYSWATGHLRLEPIKREMSRLVPIELFDVQKKGFDWHKHAGFPVPKEIITFLGEPMYPKGPYDLRGDIFEVVVGNRVVRCAFEYSDYTTVSEDILSQVDLYFKKAVNPKNPPPSKVVSIGFYARNPRLLAQARAKVLHGSYKRTIDVYGRFGTWTDSQPFRKKIVDNLKSSSLKFVGGFGTRVYPAYLEELIRTKIAVDVPGQAPATPRLVEAMALGALVVSARPACVFPEELVDGIHYVAVESDASNLVDKCQELLLDEDRRQRIVAEAMGFFDRNFSPQSMARRILRNAIERAV